MHKLIACIAILSMLFQSFGKFSWWVSFQLNRKEIAEKHCINKARPEMKCDGKCYLKSRLKKEIRETPAAAQQPVQPPYQLLKEFPLILESGHSPVLSLDKNHQYYFYRVFSEKETWPEISSPPPEMQLFA